MTNKPRTAITPTREENYAEWYQQVIRAADLAENSPVRGCMVIKPWGYALWENMQRVLDDMFKATGHQNAYFVISSMLVRSYSATPSIPQRADKPGLPGISRSRSAFCRYARP
jgi:prolyl-tRNA synthetase